MKLKFILFMLLLSFFYSSPAQFLGGYGYTGNWTGFNGLDHVIDNYNERAWLDEPLKNVNYMGGPMASYGFGFPGFWFNMEISYRRKKSTASGVHPSNGLVYRDLKVRNFQTAMALGFYAPGERWATALLLRTEFGGMGILTRVYQDEDDKGDWNDDYTGNFIVNLGPELKIINLVSTAGIALVGSIYYTHGLLKSNMTDFDNFLNQSGHGSDLDVFENSNSYFGFTILLGGVAI